MHQIISSSDLLFIYHQADVPGVGLFYHLVGNFGVAILLDGAGEALSSRSPNKVGEAYGRGMRARALSRRQGEAAAGDDEIYKKRRSSDALSSVALQISVFFRYRCLVTIMERRYALDQGSFAPESTNLFNCSACFTSIRRRCRCSDTTSVASGRSHGHHDVFR